MPTHLASRTPHPALSLRQRRWLLSIHVISGGTWLGAALCMLIIGWTNQDPAQHHPVDLVLETLDQFAMLPLPLLAVATGLLLSWGTTWGFFRWRWVVVKQAITYTLVVLAPFTVHVWIARMTDLSSAGHAGQAYADAQRMHVLASVAMVAAIAGVIAISVQKPWGRRVPSPR